MQGHGIIALRCRLMQVAISQLEPVWQTWPEEWSSWIIPQADLSLTYKEDGSKHLLGTGACGAVYAGLVHGA